MQNPKPDGVPSLDLGRLRDVDDNLKNPVTDYQDKLSPPDTASTVSWGYHNYSPAARTPALGAPFALHHTPTTTGRHSNHSQRPDSVPRLNLMAKEKSEPPVPTPSGQPKHPEQNKGPTHRAGQQTKRQLIAPYRTDNNVDCEGPNNEGASTAHHKRIEAEVLAAERRRQAIEQTVLVDQLSRAVICDPEQDQRCETPQSPFGQARPKSRLLHESKVRTAGTVTENLLDKRLSFNARILARNGHDALRELCGFYFDLDKTMTVYEFRQFGTKSKALPFIKRGSYSHVTGRRKGRRYVVQDIAEGSNLSFDTCEQPSISVNLKTRSVLLLRITHVDEGTKEKLVFNNGRVPYDPREYHDKMDPPITKQESVDERLMSQVQGSLRRQLQGRGSKTLTNLGRHFRRMDKSGDGVLSREELRAALETYHIKVDSKLFEELWLVLDQNEDGAIDYGEFRQTFLGEMSERRKTFVRKAFQKIDANKSGTVSLDELRKFFNVRKHPHVVQGLATAAEIMEDFLDLFETRQKEISYGEFEDYYEGVSVSMPNDDNFTSMMAACWTL